MPKRKGFLYEWMCDKEHIREAIVFGAKDKHDRRDVRRVLADVDGYTDRVYDLLQTQTFAPAQPKKRKIFDNSSRKWREIEYVPFFPDGIVHTLMVLAAAPVFLRGMNYWCCASVPGRGGKHALRLCKRVIHHDKKGSRYVCKMDVHHFYHSVDRRKLIWMLAHKIKDKKYLKLTWEILQTCEQGLAIGFFICQWLANFYLEPLDRYITTLDGVKYSVRYMDDIVLFGPNKKKLHRARKAIAEYLQKRLRLQMKGNWQVFSLLARAMGLDDPHFGRSVGELCREMVERSRWLTGEQKAQVLAGEPVVLDTPFPLPVETEDGKIHLADPAPITWYPPHGGPEALRLVCAPAVHTLNSSFNEVPALEQARGPMTLRMNAGDAARRGLAHGDVALCVNELGRVRFTVALDRAVVPGTVVAEGVYPGRDTVNALTHARLSDLGAATTLNDNTVEVFPLTL